MESAGAAGIARNDDHLRLSSQSDYRSFFQLRALVGSKIEGGQDGGEREQSKHGRLRIQAWNASGKTCK